jgi:hypothetical protein
MDVMTVIVKFLSLLLYSFLQIDKKKTIKKKPGQNDLINFFFCFFACLRPVSCVTNVVSISVVSILGCPFGFL